MQPVVEETAPVNSHQPSPAVSVVMPVYNVLPYLDESISSILNQTFKDFEFVILDDGSTDGSTERLREWARRDARIRLFAGSEKLGLSGSSNFVVRQARSSLIARMDGDDISHPDRLMKQWGVMKSWPEVALVGTLFEGIDARGVRVRPRDRWRLAWRTLFPAFPHGSVMFRREIFEQVGGYFEECNGWEDQDLFLRIRKRGLVVVLTQALYHYRYQMKGEVGGRSLERAARVIGLRQRCLGELRRGRDYTSLLPHAEANGHHGSALADALYLHGSMRLWAGQSPEVLKVLLDHQSLGFGARALRTLIWAAWASASPRSLRLFMRSLIRTRDLLVSYRVKDEGVHEWRLE
jgi:GT2 family glycosyltransferase